MSVCSFQILLRPQPWHWHSLNYQLSAAIVTWFTKFADVSSNCGKYLPTNSSRNFRNNSIPLTATNSFRTSKNSDSLYNLNFPNTNSLSTLSILCLTLQRRGAYCSPPFGRSAGILRTIYLYLENHLLDHNDI